MISDAGLDLIKKFEGCKLTAYKCPAGIWTVGYGHTGRDVYKGLKITQEQADTLLEFDLWTFAEGVDAAIPEEIDITDNQFAALVSLAYNIGLGNFKKSSVLKFILKQEFEKASDAFLVWKKAAGKVLPGLVRRREAERALFLTPDS